MTKGGQGWWQGTKIGSGATPIETSEGWLMFYHGFQELVMDLYIVWGLQY